MKEIEKRIIKERILDSFLQRAQLDKLGQKHLVEEALVELFGRDIVLERTKKFPLPLEHPKASDGTSNEAPVVLHNGVQMPSKGEGLAFVSDKQGSPSLDDQDPHLARLGICEEGRVICSPPSQCHPETKKMDAEGYLGLGRETSVLLVNSVKECDPGSNENINTSPIDGNDETTRKSIEKEHWICKLCNVITNSDQLFEAHCSGEKHMKKENAALKTTEPVTSSLQTCNSLLQLIDKTIQPPATATGNIFSQMKVPVKENMEAQHENDPDKLSSGPSAGMKHKIIVDEAACGTKRKIAPAIEEPASETASDDHNNKKPKKQAECKLCQVKTCTESDLEIHFRGKKHLANEKRMLESSKLELKAHAKDPMMPDVDDTPKIADWTGCETTSKYWCKVCKFGTIDEDTMANHRTGKQHMELVKMNGGNVIVKKNKPNVIINVNAGDAAEVDHNREILS